MLCFKRPLLYLFEVSLLVLYLVHIPELSLAYAGCLHPWQKHVLQQQVHTIGTLQQVRGRLERLGSNLGCSDLKVTIRSPCQLGLLSRTHDDAQHIVIALSTACRPKQCNRGLTQRLLPMATLNLLFREPTLAPSMKRMFLKCKTSLMKPARGKFDLCRLGRIAASLLFDQRLVS